MSQQQEGVGLYCGTGGSDKVYFAQLLEVGTAGWVVRCQYGPRCGSLNHADKVSDPVEYAKAKKAYDKVVKEKLGKGYEITGGGAPLAVATSATASRSAITKPSNAKLTLIQPQLLNEVESDDLETYLTSPLWVAQEKFNGDRVGLSRGLSGHVIGVSARSGLERALPVVAVAALDAANRTLLADGEQVGDVFHLFDLLEYGVRNLRSLSFDERNAVLAEIHAHLPASIFPVTYTARTEAEKRALLAELDARNAEGIVFKLISAPYEAGRPNSGGNWIKFKFWSSASVEVEAVNTKRSVAMCVYDSKGVKHSIGNVSVKPKQDIPVVGDILEIAYLYAHKGGSLVQPELIGARTDMTKKDATLKQLKYKPSGLHPSLVVLESLAA